MKSIEFSHIQLSSLFRGHQLNSNGRTSWPLMFDWHIARVLQRELMDKWHLWGNYTRAHSVWLSLVAPSCWEQLSSHSSLNETTKAVLGIMGQLVLLVPHTVLLAYLWPFIYISSLALCRISWSDSIEFNSIRTHCWGQMSHSHTPLTHRHIQTGPADQHW